MSNQVPAGTLRLVKSTGQETVVSLLIVGEDGHITPHTISRKDYEGLGAPAVGTVLSPDTLAYIEDLVARREASLTALRILEYGDNNRRTLMQKLLKKGISHTIAEDTVSHMVELGYIDEERFALRQVVLCAKRGWSRKRTHAHLVSHGFPSQTASRAILRAEEQNEADFQENRRAFIQKKQEQGLSGTALKQALWRAGF